MSKEKNFEDTPFFLLKDEDVVIKEDQVFVILPFKNTLVFERIIRPILSELGLTCKKADDIFNTSALMQDISNSIRESAIIIADLTSKNANVFYELGLAHAFKKKVILLTQSDEDIPSDLKAYKYYRYDVNTTDGINNFEDTLKKLKASIDASSIYEHTDKIYEIYSERGNPEQISSNFLKQQEGSISLWTYLDDFHITPTGTSKEWKYIISHATNKGNRKNIKIPANDNKENKEEETEIKIYPHVWAIGSVTTAGQVFWRFTCNDAGGRSTDIRSAMKLKKGWHMFSVIWSKNKDDIRFYIDDKFAARGDFEFWPNEFAEHTFIGTWPNRAEVHYFNSKIGKWIIYKNAISFEKLKEYFTNTKPE